MSKHAGVALLLTLSMLWGCTRSVLVPVAPRMDLSGYGTLGIVEFTSNHNRAIDALATRRFQEQIQAGQPGTPFVELGSREALLASVGSTQLDRDALRKIARKHGVSAIFLGDITYSAPKVEIQVRDLPKLEGGVRTEIRADISARLLEGSTGASVWSNSAWARRQIGRVNVSATYGVSGGVSTSSPHEEMVSDLVHHLTHDFRPSSVRQRAQ